MIKSIMESIHEYFSLITIIFGLLITIISLKKFKFRWCFLTSIGIILITLGFVNKVEEDKEKAKKEYSGALHPESEISILEEGDFPKLQFWIGHYNGGAITDCLGKEISKLIKRNPKYKPLENISCSYSDGDGLKISVVIRAKDGSVISKLVNNEWEVSSIKSFQRNFTRDALEVIDEYGDVVLQVRLLKDRVQILGIFYDLDGNGIAIFPGGDATGFRTLTPDDPRPRGLIIPIFKYPSDRHFGELE